VAVEEAQAAPDVIIGMILVNDNNAIVLFDSGASHSFIAAILCKNITCLIHTKELDDC
jgi:hypothetical protein